MSVVHISTNDIAGGAARAAHRLHEALSKKTGIDSSMFVRNKHSSQDSIIQFEPESSLLAKTRRFLRYVRIRSDYFPAYVLRPGSTGPLSDDRSRFSSGVVRQLPDADIYHLHWISGFVDIPAFFSNIRTPVVWTLHDMNPFTGGCHYSFGCNRYKNTCGACPRLGSETAEDPSADIWTRKRNAFKMHIQTNRLEIVAPSQWLAREAERSSLFRDAVVHRVPHGLDHQIFCPRDGKQKRKRFGIPEDQKVLLFVADRVTEGRKGFSLLAEALKNAELAGVTLLSIGSGEPKISGDLTHVHAGHVDDDQELAILYSVADVFVIPSVQEAFGQTALEAMACGTPVVGFRTGGIPDMVRPKETGWLAEVGEVRSLRRMIEVAFTNDEERKVKAARCREVIEDEYTLEHQAKHYVDIYKAITES